MDLLGQGLKCIRAPIQQSRILSRHPGDVRLRVRHRAELRQIRVSARDQLLHALLHALYRLLGGCGNRRATDD